MNIDYMATHIGLIEIQASVKGIAKVVFCESKSKAVSPSNLTDQCKEQLMQYFAGNIIRDRLPFDVQGTAFQKETWQALTQINHGDVASYSQIASIIGRPKAVRAIGAANGKNPISILVPCHRVIGSDGSLTGYAGGLSRKRWLLEHEGIKFAECLNKVQSKAKYTQHT